MAPLCTLSSLSTPLFDVRTKTEHRIPDKCWVGWWLYPLCPCWCSSASSSFFAAAAQSSLILSLLPPKTPRSLPTELFPSWAGPSLCCPPGLCFPRFTTLHLSLLKFTRFLIAHPFSLCRSSCRVVLPSKVSNSPLSLVSLANFIRVHLIQVRDLLLICPSQISAVIFCLYDRNAVYF